MTKVDLARRFGGIARLYGDEALPLLDQSHVLVAGIGGVGSWAVEALVRSGVGQFTLVDLDHVAESNINRQVHALTSTLGQSKIQAMAERMLAINPTVQINLVDDFVDKDNAGSLLQEYVPDVVLDCVDQVEAKIALLLAAKEQSCHFLMCGGAGGKTNGLALQESDLAHAKNDALLSKVRQVLRKHYGYPKGSNEQGQALKRIPKMGVACVWIDQPASLPWKDNDLNVVGLNCAGYGSCVTVTASMGLVAAQYALQKLLADIEV